MGTRGITIVVMNGKPRVAQYGQWDHYPTGQGATAMEFCKEHLSTEAGREKFRKAVAKTKFITNAEHKRLWKTVGADLDKSDGLVSMDKSEEFEKKYPHLHRDCGARILECVRKGATKLQDSMEFSEGDGGCFSCEGIYVVNLDANTLEVHYGYQIAASNLGTLARLNGAKGVAVPLVATFDLDNLHGDPEATMALLQKMVNVTCYPDDEECKGVPSLQGKSPQDVARMAMGEVPEDTSVYRGAAAKRVLDTIAAEGSCYDADGVPYLNVQDILTDLRHYCDAHGLDFAKLSSASCKRHKGQAKMDAMTEQSIAK